jgi:transcriptional regulator with XRE-family HTH domain
MKNPSAFVHDARELSRIVQAAVKDKNLSLNEISQRTGLAVPTIMRIYHGQVDKVQAKTVRALVSGLGYEHIISPSGELRIKDNPRIGPGRLTPGQKDKVLKTVMRVLREELDRL